MWSGSLGEVHRGAALVRLGVERAPLVDVMRHVGDVDAQPVVAIRQSLDGDGVVEVARVLAVDGDGRDAAEVRAAGDIARPDDRAQRACASATASSPCSSDSACLRMMMRVSTPGSSRLPSTSIDTAERVAASRSASESAR